MNRHQYCKTDDDRRLRILDIKDEMADIARAIFMPGEEVIPRLDASYEAWEFAVTSDWATLFCAGGYEDQPEFWLQDVGYFNSVYNFYSLKAELARLEADLNNS